ncbi:sigma-70 family RNA polymerase sigma factor [Marinobacter qingdaonensis]|uniref:Sigma-70 family RNA polymerase sigma factor n=1 Tax=Marinobacter qingdaonensis TaxID=3108486 RepID=A0ABU5NWA2_9GAMM|nr:sigma-70 family RNA polymerase sigma factor [Marinobacter sp. ASW11-75]MEA1080066.1 sigma-70 family RNA polymerase sigma factor [Marinobacter sp. ASW11-75]
MRKTDRLGPSPTTPNNGERDSLVGLYFRDASRYELLTDEAERRLSRKLTRCYRIISGELALPEATPQTFREVVGSLGDACAFSTRCRRAFHLATACRRKLIQSNLRLAVHIARRYSQHGIPMSDLIQDANVGLIKAAERFDPSRGFRFSTYAYWWISEEVKRCLQRGNRLVHTPENVVDEIRQLQKVSLSMHQSLGRTPSQSELAREMEATPSRIGELRALALREVSTDVPLVDDGSVTLGDSLESAEQSSPEHPMSERDRSRTLKAMLGALTEREQAILSRRYGLGLPEPHTLQVISDDLGISRERVRQIEKTAIKKLQSRFDSLEAVFGA